MECILSNAYYSSYLWRILYPLNKMIKNYDNVLLKWDFNIDLIDKGKNTNNHFSNLCLRNITRCQAC